MKKIILLAAAMFLLICLFAFSSWTNSMVVAGKDVSAGVDFSSKISPILIGMLVIVVLTLLILIEFNAS